MYKEDTSQLMLEQVCLSQGTKPFLGGGTLSWLGLDDLRVPMRSLCVVTWPVWPCVSLLESAHLWWLSSVLIFDRGFNSSMFTGAGAWVNFMLFTMRRLADCRVTSSWVALSISLRSIAFGTECVDMILLPRSFCWMAWLGRDAVTCSQLDCLSLVCTCHCLLL